MLRLCSLILFAGLCIDNCLVSALSFASLLERAKFPNPAFQNFLIQGRPKDQNGMNSVRMKKLCSSRTDSNSNEGIEDEELKREALDLLDCLTSATDENDPQFDVQKDMRRENMLLTNDYYDLKMELKERGLRTSGDKLEMITRILLHTIDPTIKYTDIAGAANQLKYVDEEDIAGEQVRVIPEAERTSSSSFFEGPDADDLAVLRPRLGQRPRRRSNNAEPSPLSDDRRDKGIGSDGTRDGGDVLQSSLNNVVGSASASASEQSTDRASNASKVPRTPQLGAMSTSELMMMDGLTRREIQMDPVVVRRAVATAQVQDVRERLQREERPVGLTGSWTAGTRKVRERVKLQAYVAGGSKDVLKTWERHAAVIVLLPDERGWRSREMRILADEIAFSNQAIVIVPDIYRGETISAESPAAFAAAAAGSAAESNTASRLPAVIEPLRRGSSKTLTATSLATSQQQQEIHLQQQQQQSNEEKRQQQRRFRAWEDKIDLDRVFDDILAAMAFVRNSYDARSISLAGVGYGAGRALEAGCALYDIAGACQWREIVLRQKQLDRQRAVEMREQERLIKAALEQLTGRGDPSPWTKSNAGSGAVVDDDRMGDVSAVELYSEHMGVAESESAEFARIDMSDDETAVKVDTKPAVNRSAPTVVKGVPAGREEITKGMRVQESSRKLTISSIDPSIVRDVAQKYSAHILRSRTASRYWGRTLDLGTGEDADTRMRNRAMGGEELQAMLEKMNVDEEEKEKFNATVAAATGAGLGANSESGATAEGRAERNLWLEQQQFEYNRRISVDANSTSSSSGSGRGSGSSGSSSSTRDRSLNGDDGDAGSGAGAGSGGDVRGQAGMGAPAYIADDAFGGDEVLQELFGNATAVLERQQQREESEQSERSAGDKTTGKSTVFRSTGEEKGAGQKSWRRLPSADEAVRAELKSLLRAHRRVQKRRSLAVTSSSRQAVGGGQQMTSDRAQLAGSGAGVDATLERKQQIVGEAVNQRLIESLLEDDESDSRRSATTNMEAAITAKVKAQAQATKAAASLAHEYSFETLSMEEIATQLVPRACLALCPNRYDVAAVGNQIQMPVFLVYAANDSSPGARPIDALAMSEAMMRRSDDIFDFCVRSYSGRGPSFLLSTQTELDQRCRQEAIGAGSIWLDVFSAVNATELTDEAGRTKHTAQAFVTVDPDRDLRPPPGFRNFGASSPVATYLHDDPSILFPESTSAS